MSAMQNDGIGANHGISMILSPAKTLDLTPLSDRKFDYQDVNADVIGKLSDVHSLSACDKTKTDMIVNVMKKKNEGELKSLLKLSPALANASHEVSEHQSFH
jgi:hypothetical protein